MPMSSAEDKSENYKYRFICAKEIAFAHYRPEAVIHRFTSENLRDKALLLIGLDMPD